MNEELMSILARKHALPSSKPPRSDRNAERSWTLDKAMKRIGEEGGVLVVLGHEESTDLLIHRVKMFEAQVNNI